ncbi:MAG: ribonuclease HII [Nitrospirota bacterium]|nr:ribonuclease HII [Nitrospirota bacterium]
MPSSVQPTLPFEAEVPDLYRFEREAAAGGFRMVAGVDEAGRGPLAGPVVAAAVILNAPPGEPLIEGLNDSKQLSAARREALYPLIMEKALSVGVGIVDATEIDRINILQATIVAMKQAIAGLSASPDFVLLDALTLPDFLIPQKGIIKGDASSASIAAASIVAKVTRDRMMDELHQRFPQYGFNVHKGYGTRLHLDRLREHGPSDIHRKSFRGVVA